MNIQRRLWLVVVVGALVCIGAVGLLIAKFTPETMLLSGKAMSWFPLVLKGLIGLGVALMTTGLAWMYFFSSVQKKALPFLCLVQRKTNLVQLVRQVVNELQLDPRFIDYQLQLRSKQTACYSEIDRAWFGWALRNLLLYLLQHNPPHTDIRVVVQARSQREITIKISDNGQGIAPSTFGHLFDREGTEESIGVEGSRWSVSIADQLIAAHGGELNMASRQGIGTLIEIHLPGIWKEKSPDSYMRNPDFFY